MVLTASPRQTSLCGFLLILFFLKRKEWLLKNIRWLEAAGAGPDGLLYMMRRAPGAGGDRYGVGRGFAPPGTPLPRTVSYEADRAGVLPP